MDLPIEEVNYVKIAKIVLDVVPKYLRKCFIEVWNVKNPTNKWNSDSKSGIFLVNKIPSNIKNSSSRVKEIEKLKAGDEAKWDITVLVFVLLDAGLKLVEGSRQPVERKPPLRMSEEIEIIRDIRNDYYGHVKSMSCKMEDFLEIMSKITSVAENIFDEDAESEIEEIKKAQFGKKALEQVKCQLQEYYNNLKEGLIEKYLSICGTHPINSKDEHDQIIPKELDFKDFHVNLKIAYYSPPAETFKDETTRLVESFTDSTSGDIDVTQLTSNDKRITYIRGAAGIGKTVLAKKLAYDWAERTKNQEKEQFQLCIMFECRELNGYVLSKDKEKGKKKRKKKCKDSELCELFTEKKKCKLLRQFLRAKFDYDLGLGEGILIIADGMDELIDIRKSIITPLLTSNICSASKIIITGRPHIEGIIKSFRETGGLQGVEIQGLSDEQIVEYVAMFNSVQSAAVNLSSGRLPSQKFISILHIPHFLNTFCCIAAKLKGKRIRNEAELYTWAIFLLLKQDSAKQKSAKDEFSEIFAEYSKELFNLGKACYTLLGENKIVLTEEEFKRLLPGGSRGKEFIEGLFVDVADNFEVKHQFNHLTIMQFLCAIYICSRKDRLNVIKDHLQKNFIDTVVYSCQLIGGISSTNIIRELLVKAGGLVSVDQGSFLSTILEMFQKCSLERDVKFRLSQNLITCFLHENAIDKQLMIANIKLLNCDDFYSSPEQSMKLYDISKDLKKIFKCNESDLREAFDNFYFRHFYVNEYESITVSKYLKDVRWIILFEMNIKLAEVRSKLHSVIKDGGTVKRFSMRKCELEDDTTSEKQLVIHLDVLSINTCRFRNEKSFLNTMQWGASSFEDVRLRYLPNIEHIWWWKLIEVIEKNSQANGMLRMKKLDLFKCNPITKEMNEKMKRCGVEVTCSTFANPTNLICETATRIDAKEDQRSELKAPREIELKEESHQEMQFNKKFHDCKELEEGNSSRIHDNVLKLEIPNDQVNFIKIKKILMSILPKYLRELFKRRWNERFPENIWECGIGSGQLLADKIPRNFKEKQDNNHKINMIRNGYVNQWGINTLTLIMLDFDLELTDACIRHELELLRDIEKKVLSGNLKELCSATTFAAILIELKRVSRTIFGEDAEREIVAIEDSQMNRKMSIKRRRLKRESHDYLEGYISSMEMSIEEANFTTIDVTLLNIATKHMRKYFIDQWNANFPDTIWLSDEASGKHLVSELSQVVDIMGCNHEKEIERLKMGKEQKWNIASLALAMLVAEGQLIAKTQPNDEENSQLSTKKDLEFLTAMEIFSEQNLSMVCSTEEFESIALRMKSASKNLFGRDAEMEVDEVIISHMKKIRAVRMKGLLSKEMTSKGDLVQMYDRGRELQSENDGKEKLETSSIGLLELTNEAHNFVRLAKIILTIIPKYLSKVFKDLWDIKHPTQKWESNSNSGEILLNNLPLAVQDGTLRKREAIQLKEGKEYEWDITTQIYVLLEDGLELTKVADDKHKAISIIKDTRNSVIGHALEMSCSNEDFDIYMKDLLSVAQQLFDVDATKDLERIQKSQMQVPISEQEMHQLLEEIEQELKDGLVARYEISCKKHQINSVDRMGEVILNEAEIEKFAVELVATQTIIPEDMLESKAKHQSDHDAYSQNGLIQLNQLVDSDHHVIFIQGIAGIGKSVLAKKMALHWKNDELDFKFCIMFTCRQINDFANNRKAEEHKILDEFLKTEFKFNLKNYKGVLFIVDGFNDLDNIYAKNCIMLQLLDSNNPKYGASKVVITGRTHIRYELLEASNATYGLKEIQVQGLTDNQVKKYISKFSSFNESMQGIDMNMKLSERIMPILAVPQYLNTFCCIAILLKGKPSPAEAYCWTLFLLLKQHCDGMPSESETIPAIFRTFSTKLLALSKVCYELLYENYALSKSEESTRLFEILFGELSDNFKEKHRSRYLHMIEFFSAIYVCSIKNRVDSMRDILNRGFIDTVLFISELTAKFQVKGEITEMLLIAVADVKVCPFTLDEIVEVVSESSLDERRKFHILLDISVTFLTTEVKSKNSILRSLKKLHCGPSYISEVKESNNLFTISSCLKDNFNCSEEEILQAFENIYIGELMVNEVKAVRCAKYLQSTHLINFCGISVNLNDARREVERIDAAKCSFVWMENCEFEFDKVEKTHRRHGRAGLDELVIWNSHLNKESFSILCDWGASSGTLILGQLEIEKEWWLMLVKAVTSKKEEGELRMRELHIIECLPKMTDEVLRKIANCDVTVMQH